MRYKYQYILKKYLPDAIINNRLFGTVFTKLQNTSQKWAGYQEFNDLLEAIQYMNAHHAENFPNITSAEIYDLEQKKIVCAKRQI